MGWILWFNYLGYFRFTAHLEIVEESVDQPEVGGGRLARMDHSFLGRIEEVQEVGFLGHTELDFLFFRQKLVDIPITHNIYNSCYELRISDDYVSLSLRQQPQHLGQKVAEAHREVQVPQTCGLPAVQIQPCPLVSNKIGSLASVK